MSFQTFSSINYGAIPIMLHSSFWCLNCLDVRKNSLASDYHEMKFVFIFRSTSFASWSLPIAPTVVGIDCQISKSELVFPWITTEIPTPYVEDYIRSKMKPRVLCVQIPCWEDMWILSFLDRIKFLLYVKSKCTLRSSKPWKIPKTTAEININWIGLYFHVTQ